VTLAWWRRHPEAAARPFLAFVDVLRVSRHQRVRVEAHLRFREVAFFPRLRRIERRASGDSEDDHQKR